MSVLAMLGRILIQVVQQPGVRDVFTTVGSYVARQASAAIINKIRNLTPPKGGIKTIR